MAAEDFVAIVVILLILFAVPLISAEVTRRRLDARLQAKGVFAQAEIVDLRVLSTQMDTNPPRIVFYRYAISYSFAIDTADRGTVRYTGEYRMSLPNAASALVASGTLLRIRYLPSDPRVSRVENIWVGAKLVGIGG
jgi:hypothetical protein